MKCDINGVIIRQLKKYTDGRGWLIELYRRDELEAEFTPAMSYVSMTSPGVVRGPHEHLDQADCFCFIGPSTFRLYLWDNRADSVTYGLKATYDLGEPNPATVIVPKGVVHAYKNIGSIDGIVYNAPNRLYAGEGRRDPVDEIRHEDDSNTQFKLD
jgi:dTDP-4-dehydrorhamnose 3,5-epimerase